VSLFGCSFEHGTLADPPMSDGGRDGGRDGAGPTPDTLPSSDGDGDGDSILDAVDNCPATPNPMQFNEDLDRFGDVCDPCPADGDDNPPDADGDGVGDACDPRPTTAGDRIVIFEGFHAGMPSGWDVAGAWTITNDAAGVDAPMATVAWLTTPFAASAAETVTASVAVGTAPHTGTTGVTNMHQAGADSGTYCSLYVYNGFVPSPGLALALFDASNYAVTAYEMTVGSTYRISLRRENNSYACAATTTGANASTSRNFNLSAVGAGLRVAGAAARFHWLMIVTND
jgi:hypothetical protein